MNQSKILIVLLGLLALLVIFVLLGQYVLFNKEVSQQRTLSAIQNIMLTTPSPSPEVSPSPSSSPELKSVTIKKPVVTPVGVPVAQ